MMNCFVNLRHVFTSSLARGVMLAIAMLILVGANGSSNSSNSSIATESMESLSGRALADPFNLDLVIEIETRRAQEAKLYKEALAALADGLEARLRDDGQKAGEKLRLADAAPKVRTLAQALLTDTLWQALLGGPGEHIPQALCSLCGDTGMMDCSACGGDGFRRDIICQRCGGAGVVACTHPLHEKREAGSFMSPQDRKNIERTITIAQYLLEGGIDWFTTNAFAPSPKLSLKP